jgi:valyl-tRNA synthetase
MVKVRLYELDDGDSRKAAAKYTLHLVLLAIIQMFAPIMPYVT